MEKLCEVLTMLEPALKAGCVFTIYKAEKGMLIDLETGAKSSCKLVLEGDEIVAYRRYDRRDIVTDWEQLVELVHECGHGRTFFDGAWQTVFDEAGMESPIGAF